MSCKLTPEPAPKREDYTDVNKWIYDWARWLTRYEPVVADWKLVADLNHAGFNLEEKMRLALYVSGALSVSSQEAQTIMHVVIKDVLQQQAKLNSETNEQACKRSPQQELL